MVDALFPSEKKRDLKIKTIRGDEIQISIISFSATSIKNSTAASHLTGRGKKRERGGGGGKKERVTNRKSEEEKVARETLSIHANNFQLESNSRWKR